MFDELCSWENLLLAYRRASLGKRGHVNVAAFEHCLEDNLLTLRFELQNGHYLPGKYHSFYVHEPKRRLISAAPFRDRVVHHALCNLTEPLFERSFIFDSYANRVGKGTHRALNRVQHYARQFPYFLQCDIRQFFPSIDHIILKDILNKLIVDARVMRLVNSILESGEGVLSEATSMQYFPGDDLLAACRPRGLPIGNLTSQLWANLYLNGFDHFIKRTLRCQAYVRYVDDFVLFARDKATLWTWKNAIEHRLVNLRLLIHPEAQPRPVDEGISFLGFVVFPNKRRLKRRKGLYYQRKFKRMLRLYCHKRITWQQVNASVQGWVNHVRYANTVGLRKVLFRSGLIRPGG